MDAEAYDLHYLQLLAKQYPTIQAASAAIVEMNAQLSLPKGTEHFVSDVHGEYEAFRHVLKNGSGSIKRRIDELFAGSLPGDERRNLATLVYYPEERLPLILRRVPDAAEWYHATLARLLRLCRVVAAKYPRQRVRVFLPEDLASIVEEMLYQEEHAPDKDEYYGCLIDTVVSTGVAGAVIVALAELIQRLAIARLHVIGDVYDRGPGADLIMDTLMDYHSVDLQWGNHDIVWMGAAAGSDACIASVIRIALRYGNVETVEHGYGISLLPLASFAIDTYGSDPCERFMTSPAGRPAGKGDDEADVLPDDEQTENERRLVARMHKAIAIIQLKLEAQIIQRRPRYHMEGRLLLDKINFRKGTVRLDGAVYPLLDTLFPTVDPDDPYALTPREQSVMERLKGGFASSRRLQQHVRFLYSKGGMYRVHNGNLLYHGCIPMNADGSFRALEFPDGTYAARELMDRLDRLARQGYFAGEDAARKQEGLDTLWYLWSGADSPLFGKEKMATFERYFIGEKATHAEARNAYYTYRDQEATARRILEAFGADPDTGHIVNGHVPVKVRQGESPVKAGGKLIVIDGGFARAYQKQTGIAGYTLVYNSHGLLLAAHRPFESAQKAISEEVDIDSTTQILEHNTARIHVRDTDLGREFQERIDDLRALLAAYRSGLVQEG